MKEGGDYLDSRSFALKLAEEIEKKKGQDILLIEVRQHLYLTDYFLITSVNSFRQARSMVETVEKKAKQLGVPFVRVEGNERSGWILMDVGDVVVHIFDSQLRNYYQLERLWKDAPILTIESRKEAQ